jgi:NhaP-type Na+/H+ or K+/H+ antiporter
MKEQIIMGYGGLRGAVGFSLAVVLSQVGGKQPLIGC